VLKKRGKAAIWETVDDLTTIYTGDPSLAACQEICICWAGSGEAEAGGEHDGSRGAASQLSFQKLLRICHHHLA
jgi:hypothetical protein